MPRAHVEFIQSQALPWGPSPWPHLAGCHVKLLSRDAATGAASALVRFPMEWAARAAGALSAGQEFLVLEGALDVNGRRYEQDCYAALPAGYPYRSCQSPAGAIALAFFDAEPHFEAGAGAGDTPPPSGTVEFLDAYRMRWSASGMDPAYGEVGLRWKLLRGDPAGDGASMLVCAPPHLHPPAWSGPQEVHDCCEEMYLLSGDYQSNVGHMYGGAYFWRPPGIAHGPYGTRGGNLALIRTLGAPLVNHWTSHEITIGREPAYRPSLPESMRSQLGAPWKPQLY